MNWWLAYTGAWLAALLLGAVFTRVCIRLAPRLGFVDKPLNEAHKKHVTVTPVMGGIAMMGAWLVTILGGLGVVIFPPAFLGSEITDGLRGVGMVGSRLALIVGGGVAMTLLGMADDRRAMKAHTKFAGQILVAGIVSWWGIRITAFITWGPVTWLITLAWILTVINAVNFFDNMDGLAAGTSAIAAALFLFTAAVRGQFFVGAFAAVTCGAACGFLLYNKPPARIFMGDAGSHFLGYMLAVLGALTTFYRPADSPTLAPVLTPLLILGLPVFDAAAVVVMRLSRGQPVYIGDNTHMSHRFNNLGLSRPDAVRLVCLLSFIVGSGAVSLLWLPPAGALVVLLQSAAVLTVVMIIQFRVPPRTED